MRIHAKADFSIRIDESGWAPAISTSRIQCFSATVISAAHSWMLPGTNHSRCPPAIPPTEPCGSMSSPLGDSRSSLTRVSKIAQVLDRDRPLSPDMPPAMNTDVGICGRAEGPDSTAIDCRAISRERGRNGSPVQPRREVGQPGARHGGRTHAWPPSASPSGKRGWRICSRLKSQSDTIVPF
jgi:hypothetical protein